MLLETICKGMEHVERGSKQSKAALALDGVCGKENNLSEKRHKPR